MTSQRNFLFTTINGGGSVPPTMELVDRLARRGHRIRVMSHEMHDETEAAGGTFVPWKSVPNPTGGSRETAFKDWELTAADTIRLLNQMLGCDAALPFAQDVIAELDREPADAVVNFDALHGASLGAEARGTKLALFSTGLSVSPLPGVPPQGSALPPARTPAEQAEIDRVSRHIWSGGIDALNAARVALGLTPLESVLDQFERADLRLIGTARAFDFPSTGLPMNVRYTGPLVRAPVWTKPWVSPWPSGDMRPLVLVGFSTTFQDHIACLQRVIDALADLPVRALVTLGGAILPHEVTPRGNTAIVESAPHDVVMREAALVVTHGGHGTVMTALMHRLPMLVIPHGRDQGDNAVRIAERGAGLSLPNASSTEDMRAALARLLNEPSFDANARKLGDIVAREADQSTLIADLEALVSAS